MEVQSIETLLSRAGNSTYRLVRMASLRALELADGKPALLRTEFPDKLASVALKEIEAGKICYKEVADKVKAELESKKEDNSQ